MDAFVLKKSQYIKLKQMAYQVYIIDHKFLSNKAQKAMNIEIEKYDNEELKTIIFNTLLFPFDVELYNFLLDKKLNEDTILLAADKFDIPADVVKQKSQEYTKYLFMNCVKDGSIDYSTISQLSKQLLSTSQDEKNQKIS